MSDAALAGELASARHGKLAGQVALPDLPEPTKCNGWCSTLTVESLLYWGRTRGTCPCTESWPVPA